MGKGGTAIALKRAEHGIGIDLVAGPGQEPAGVITGKVVTQRSNGASPANDVSTRAAGLQDSIAYLKCAVDDETSAIFSCVAADCTVCDSSTDDDEEASTIAAALTQLSIAAYRAVT